MEFNEKLKKARIEKGMTQQELADQLFISRSAVAKWESGLGMPSKESLEKICSTFDIQEEDILTDDAEETNVKKNNKIKILKIALISSSIAFLIFVIVVIVIWNTHPQKVLAKYKIEAPETKLNGVECNLVDDMYLYYIYDGSQPAGFQLTYKTAQVGNVPISGLDLKTDDIKKMNIVNQDTKYLLEADNIIWDKSFIHVYFEYLDDDYNFLSNFMVFEEYDYYKYIVFKNDSFSSAIFPIEIDYTNHLINIPYKTKYMMLITINVGFKIFVEEIKEYRYVSFNYHFLAK